MRFLVLIFFALLINTLRSQTVLNGHVSAADSSSMLADVVVQVAETGFAMLTDSSGYFHLDVPARGKIQLVIRKQGYRPQVREVELPHPADLDFGLQPALNDLSEVVVYGDQTHLPSQTPGQIETLSAIEIQRSGAGTLSEAMTRLPGVTQLSTGPGISKPVVRGLYGNRLQVVLFGMRFDNQQWQDEHGLGLSPAGVGQVEVIKGPSSLLYGSEAMGGLINILGPITTENEKTSYKLRTQFYSNTYGSSTEFSAGKSSGKRSWNLLVAEDSHADYSDGKGKRVLNSRYGGSTAIGSYAFRRKNWSSQNTGFFSLYKFGFVMDAYQLLEKADARLSRTFERPHHQVLLSMFSTQNTVLLPHSTLRVNAGFFYNDRQEQEGSGGVSLHMLLGTYAAMLSWQKKINPHNEITISSQNQYQTNLNTGSRILIPDALSGEHSLAAFLSSKHEALVFEGGLRYDLRYIQTRQTGLLNNGNLYNPGNKILPVYRQYNCVNAAAGLSYEPFSFLLLKINESSGYRSPNLAELSSNGLHEGSFRYEVGDVNLRTERNLCSDVHLRLKGRHLSVLGNLFLNYFRDYIYLQGTDADYLGLRIYQYVQKDAMLKGFETGVSYQLNRLDVSVVYAGVKGQTLSKENLPFIPANKLSPKLSYRFKLRSNRYDLHANCGMDYFEKQDHFGQFETETPAYYVLNAGCHLDVKLGKKSLTAGLTGTNLTNTYYYDHLSRMKYFGVYNMGRNLVFNLQLHL